MHEKMQRRVVKSMDQGTHMHVIASGPYRNMVKNVENILRGKLQIKKCAKCAKCAKWQNVKEVLQSIIFN